MMNGMIICKYCCVLFLSITSLYPTTSGKIILSTNGPIRGINYATENLNVHAFLGIPYAEPPIGELRFAKPVPKRSWEYIYNATENPPPCPQNVSGDYYFNPNVENMSEDCLFLNIWVPNLPKTNKISKPFAVMVWIHGGAFTLGYSALDVSNGVKLAARGEVIVASINYRVGVFGFLTALVEEANGNMGMFDQVLALQWLKENVANFGGDPERITLFGESAGSISISLHIVSPLTRGLFRRAILESGTSLIPLSFNVTDSQIKSSNSIARIVKCANHSNNIITNPHDVVDCMKRIPMETLAKAEGQLRSIRFFTFFPRYGDEYLPSSVFEAMHEFQYKTTELLIGHNQDEGSLFLAVTLQDYFGKYGWNGTETVSKRLAKSLINAIFQALGQKDISKIINAYIVNNKTKTSDDFRRAIYNSMGDFLITCSSIFFADFQSRNNSKLYYYVFAHESHNSVLADWMGVTHYEEIQYVFGNPLMNKTFTSAENEVSDRMIDRWTTFAKTGNPNIPNAIKWPTYSYKSPFYLHIDVEEKVKKYPSNKQCEFWRSRFQSDFDTSQIFQDSELSLSSNKSVMSLQKTIAFTFIVICIIKNIFL